MQSRQLHHLSQQLNIQRKIDVSAADRVTYGSAEDRSFPGEKLGPGCNVHLASGIKEVSRVPVICVGNIRGLEQAETILAAEEADLVAMGRALIADPGLVGKVRDANASSVVKCAKCSKCICFLYGEMSMSCPLDDDL